MNTWSFRSAALDLLWRPHEKVSEMNAVATDLFPPNRQSVDCDENQSREVALAFFEREFSRMTAEARVRWSLERLPGNRVLSSSFGAQAAVSLHLLTRAAPGIPVILVDTGLPVPGDLPIHRSTQ